MKIRVFEGTAVITTSLSMEVIQKAEAICPEALVMTELNSEDELVETFKLACSGNGNSSISAYGILFNKEGKIRIQLPSNIASEDVKQYIKSTYGAALVNLKEYEMFLEDNINTCLAKYDELDEEIEIVE